MFSSFFALLKSPAGLFRGFTPPGRKASPRGVFHMSNTTKILHFYLERVHLQSIWGKALQRLGQ